MPIVFSREQQQAIQLHNRNILVSAAAGSGKTAVLVERIIRMVCDEAHPVDIDRLLVVTFTNAAASEMRERIAAGIAEKLRLHPESEHIQKQFTLLHNAQITTIDSFSLFLIRNHFDEIGLDPAFRVADEGEIRLLRQEVLGRLLEEAFAAKSDAFASCVEYFCPRGRESVLENHILDLSRYAASFPWPEEWLLARKEDYRAEDVEALEKSEYGRYLREHVGKLLLGCAEKMRRVLGLCESPDGPYMYGETVERELEQLERLAACGSLEEYAGRIPTVCFGRLPSKKDDSVSARKRELAREMRRQVKEVLQEIAEKFFATPLFLAAKQGRACAEPTGILIDLVLEFDRRMKQRKQEKKIIDFSDMEHYALDILLTREGDEVRPSPVALEYRQYFEEVLIDEYQDSNLVQEYLLRAVSGEEDGHFNRFMVGDVKQSIYKFRLARPELFLEKYQDYGEEGDCRRIDLSRNYRSRSQVVGSVNDIFGRIMSKECGGIEYDDRAALYAGAVFPENEDCGSELLLVDRSTGENTPVDPSGKPLSPKRLEAVAVARRIKRLKETFQVTDRADGTLRPVEYRDMVILLRTTSGWDEEFKEALEEEGIPSYITSRTGYFAASEVQELLQFLRVLDNPLQDIPLFGAMKSVFGGFAEEEIARIRSGKKEGSLYEALCAYAGRGEEATGKEAAKEEAEGEEGLIEKAGAFLRQIDAYRDAMIYLPIRELLQRISDDYGYLDYVTALPAGGRRRANVEMLFTRASDFEKTSYFGLFHFVRYMEQLEKYDVDYGEADVLDENADVVRIMSIHKSKGLEFPVTFVSGLGKRFNMQDASQPLIVDMDLGLACDYVDVSRRVRNRTLRRAALSRKLREDALSEELRVLYVAFTRAREKLILTASLERAGEKWELAGEREERRLSYLDFMEAGSCLDFLLPVLKGTSVEVSVLSGEELTREAAAEQVRLYGKRSVLEGAAACVDEEALKGLRERFSYEYPYRSLEKLYTKTTVSELKIAAMAEKDEEAYHAFEEREVVPYLPAFVRGEGEVSGTVRGNAYHRVMELLDFEALLGGLYDRFPETYEAYRAGLDRGRLAGGLKTFLETEAASQRLSREYLGALRREKLLEFLGQRIAYRMWAAQRRGQLYREQPFVLGIEAGRLSPDFPPQERVLIQGIIDVYFIEDGELVLLDYKTDVIASMEDLWKRYAVQLDYYEEALTKLQQLPLKEKLLYSFYLGTCGATPQPVS